MTGSHLDTQPTGGKFDGVYGVLAGLEVIESLNEHAIDTLHPIEVGVWCNEEGCRFPMAMMGSAVWAGRLPLERAYALTDRERQQRTRRSSSGSAWIFVAPLSRQPVKAALEVHIEQGPVLEQQSKTHRHRDRRAAHVPLRSHGARTGGARRPHADGHAARSDPRAGARRCPPCMRRRRSADRRRV